jgi:WD40 repeat protein
VLGPLHGPLQGYNKGILSIHITSEGRQILSVAEDWTVRAWDAIFSANVLVSSLQNPNVFGCKFDAAFSTDGQQFMTSLPGGHVGIWDPISGEHIRVITSDSPGNRKEAMA